MKINRKELLGSLLSVSSGVTKKEITGQSNSFVFGNREVRTYSNDIVGSCSVPLGIEGVVVGHPLLETLKKLPDEDLDLSVDNDKLVVKGKRRRVYFFT